MKGLFVYCTTLFAVLQNTYQIFSGVLLNIKLFVANIKEDDAAI